MKKVIFALQAILLIYALTACSNRIDKVNISEKIDENRQDIVIQDEFPKKEGNATRIKSGSGGNFRYIKNKNT